MSLKGTWNRIVMAAIDKGLRDPYAELQKAAAHDNGEMIRALLDKFPMKGRPAGESFAVLRWAVFTRQADLKPIASKLGGLNIRDDAGAGVLHHLAAERKSEALQDFLLTGANPDIQDMHRRTPLHYAARAGNLLAVRVLTGLGANADARDVEGQSPLHYAMQAGHGPVARELARNGADEDGQDRHGRRPADLVAKPDTPPAAPKGPTGPGV